MRFYLVSFERAGERTRLGTTSAVEAALAIRTMSRDGWTMSLIKRGSEMITEADLEEDAKLERARAH